MNISSFKILRSLCSSFLLCAFLLLAITSCHKSNTVTKTSAKATSTDCVDESKKRSNNMCSKIYNPVCGCDGVTYNNACFATNNGVLSHTQGPCPDKVAKDDDCIDQSKIDPQKACYRLYKPVCGCNGITYTNDCEAEKQGVKKWTDGKCLDKK